MSVQIENVTERQLKFGVLKVALVLTVGLLIAAFVASLLIQSDHPFAQIPINALLIAVAVMILANGCLAILQIIDWFEGRRVKRGASNG